MKQLLFAALTIITVARLHKNKMFWMQT